MTTTKTQLLKKKPKHSLTMSFYVLEHIERFHSWDLKGKPVAHWFTKLEEVGDSNHIVERLGRYGKIGDKIDLK